MFRGLPDSIEAFKDWGWSQIQPYAQDLEERVVDGSSLHQWLRDWASLSNLITETYTRLEIRTTTHTIDEENLERYERYGEEVIPKFRAFENNLKRKLLESGEEPENFSVPLRKMRTEAALFREENLPLATEIDRLRTEYSKLAGAQIVNWDESELTMTQMYAKLTESDRGIRERAWRLLSARAQEDRNAIDAIWSKLLTLREQQASNAGYADYRSFRWDELGRVDYTPQDCIAFHEVIERYVVPAAGRLSERRRERLGLDTIRVWDDFWFFRPDSANQPPLRPYETIHELNEKIETICTRVDPELGGYYRIMREEGLLDLESRKHKTGGAYMAEMPFTNRPYIFANAVGTQSDVMTQLHEGGHAFHFFESAHWPYHHQSSMEYIPMEFLEVGSMAMEMLAAPYLSANQGGFYSEEEAARARIGLLEDNLGFWPYMAVVDAFQHWIYENTEDARNPDTCDEVWESLHRRFLPHLDWSGIEDTLRFFWRKQGHIFSSPFYYIEYGLALLGATQVWANALEDQSSAVQSYRKALRLGATASLPNLYQAAGAKFSFDDSVFPKMVDLIEDTIAGLENA